MEQLQQGITRSQVLAQHSNGVAAMPDAFSFHQHSSIAEVEASAAQHSSQFMVTASIADGQIRQPSE